MAKKAPKCPKMPKNGTFCLNIWSFHCFFWNSVKLWRQLYTKYKTMFTDLGKTLVCIPWGLIGPKTPLLGAVFQIYRIIDMNVYLVVFHGVELKNKCFSTWNCTACPFSGGIEVFLGLNQGGGGMLDLELLKMFFLEKIFASKFIFIRCWFHFHCFWFILGRGAGESWDLVIFPRFSIFY